MQLNKITVLFNWEEEKQNDNKQIYILKSVILRSDSAGLSSEDQRRGFTLFNNDRSGAFYFLLNDKLYLTDHSI